MEQLQASVAPASAESGAACVSCHSAVEGPRCSHCGAAQVAGGYRALRVIAQTAHSRMYLAEDENGRKVALKELMFALVPGVEQLAAFERETGVLRALSHSQIPSFVRAFTEGSGVGTRLYLAQEFIQGESLAQRLLRQRLTEDEAWNLAEQTLEVLHHLHTRQPRLVHRDVKPANLILREGAPMALVDFGAVRDLTRELTHGSTLVGTFGYMPPEQLGGTVDGTSDLYGLGATLVHGLTGIPPAELLVEGMELQFDHKLPPDLSSELRAFLKRLVAPRRSGRFPSADEALQALRARGQTVLRPDALKRASGARARASRTRLWFTSAMVGVALAAAGLGMLSFWRSDTGLSQGPVDDVQIDAPAQAASPQFGLAGQVVPVSDERQDHRYMRHSPDEKGFIQMKLGVSERWTIPMKDVRRVAVEDPGVAEVSNLDGRHTMIGVRPGHTRVIVWTDEKRTGYSVTVE